MLIRTFANVDRHFCFCFIYIVFEQKKGGREQGKKKKKKESEARRRIAARTNKVNALWDAHYYVNTRTGHGALYFYNVLHAFVQQ